MQNPSSALLSPGLAGRRAVPSVLRKTFVFGLAAGSLLAASAVSAQQVNDVFVIAMENTNWTQVANQFTGSQQQIYQNPAAPYINSLVNGTATISSQVSYASAYHNVLAAADGSGPSIHPSEPNYLWSEAGTNFGVLNDNQPYQTPGGTNQSTTAHLATLLTTAGVSWKSYQEDIDMTPASGGVNTPGSNSLTNSVAGQGAWTVPLINFSGTSTQGYVNPYNNSAQYDYAAKHNPMLFFTDTNGGNISDNTNTARLNYSPLQQLSTDLTNNTVSKYNWITPDQFNDMHTGLKNSFTYNGTTYSNLTAQVGAEKIAQGDNFLSILIPEIMASAAYQNNGAIILWWDESEPDGSGNQNDFNHTIPEIVISPLAHPNVSGLPYNYTGNLTHSDDLHSMQDLFNAYNASGNPYLGDAQNAGGIGGLFQTPTVIPEPSTYAGWFGLGALGLVGALRARNRAQRT